MKAGSVFVERVHLPFIAAALALAILGGFALAIALPVTAALRGHITASWVEHAQVHGHLQAVGFVGLFVVGMGYRLLPRFAGRTLAYPRLVPPTFWLLVGGVILRAVAQPVGDIGAFSALLGASGWIELAGIGCFALNVVATAWPATRAGEPYALFFTAGAIWFAVQAALGAAWLTELAVDGRSVLPGDRDGALIFLQLFGVHLMFIFGVGLRAFPTFFGADVPNRRALLAAYALLQATLLTTLAAGLLDVGATRRPWLLEDLGLLGLGFGLIWTTSFTGAWRRPTRIRPASRAAAFTLQPAMGWLAIAALLLIAFAVRGLAREAPPTGAQMDAIRHIVAVGVVLMTIVGMAQLVLPEFAGERLVGRQRAWRGIGFGVLLSIAAALRAGARLFEEQLPGETDQWMMALAGTIALGVIAAFAWLYVRGVRGFGRVIELAAARMASTDGPG